MYGTRPEKREGTGLTQRNLIHYRSDIQKKKSNNGDNTFVFVFRVMSVKPINSVRLAENTATYVIRHVMNNYMITDKEMKDWQNNGFDVRIMYINQFAFKNYIDQITRSDYLASVIEGESGDYLIIGPMKLSKAESLGDVSTLLISRAGI